MEKKTIIAEEYPNLIPRVISALYRIGYDEIDIEYQDPALVTPLLEVLNEFFPGYDILSQSEKRMLIKDIAHDVENEFDNVLRRLFMVSLSMAENLEMAMKEFSEQRMLNVLSMEKTNNRFANYCIRMLIKRGHQQFNRTDFYIILVWEMEKMIDELKYIGQYRMSPEMKNVKLSQNLMLFYHDLVDMFRWLFEVFYKFDPEKINMIHMKRKEMIKQGTLLLQKGPEKERKIVHNIMVSSQKIANMSGSYLGIAL